jgi:hypothetical protein
MSNIERANCHFVVCTPPDGKTHGSPSKFRDILPEKVHLDRNLKVVERCELE